MIEISLRCKYDTIRIVYASLYTHTHSHACALERERKGGGREKGREKKINKKKTRKAEMEITREKRRIYYFTFDTTQRIVFPLGSGSARLSGKVLKQRRWFVMRLTPHRGRQQRQALGCFRRIKRKLCRCNRPIRNRSRRSPAAVPEEETFVCTVLEALQFPARPRDVSFRRGSFVRSCSTPVFATVSRTVTAVKRAAA